MHKVVIIDDHQLFSSGLALLLGELSHDVSVVSYVSVDEVLISQLEKPSLVILDFYLPGTSFSETFLELKQKFSSPIMVVSASPSPNDRTLAQQAGAIAFVSKHSSPQILLSAVASVLEGQSVDESNIDVLSNLAELGLTERQMEILLLVSKGCSNKEIGKLMEVSPETVKSHLKTIFRRTNVQNRIEAVEFIRQYGVM